MSDQVEALQARVDELQAYVASLHRHPAMVADVLGITKTHARILLALRGASPKRMFRRDLSAMLFGDRDVSRKLLDVHISQMRRKLAPHGLAIDSSTGNTRPGWGLTAENAAALDAVLENLLAGQVGSAA